MKLFIGKFLLATILLITNCEIYSQNKVTTQDIDWANLISQHDMYWHQITTDYYAVAIMFQKFTSLQSNDIYKIIKR